MTEAEDDNLFAGVAWALILSLTVLVVLKGCGLIDWSWWFLLAPLWLPVACCGSLILILALAYLIAFGGGSGH